MPPKKIPPFEPYLSENSDDDDTGKGFGGLGGLGGFSKKISKHDDDDNRSTTSSKGGFGGLGGLAAATKVPTTKAVASTSKQPVPASTSTSTTDIQILKLIEQQTKVLKDISDKCLTPVSDQLTKITKKLDSINIRIENDSTQALQSILTNVKNSLSTDIIYMVVPDTSIALTKEAILNSEKQFVIVNNIEQLFNIKLDEEEDDEEEDDDNDDDKKKI